MNSSHRLFACALTTTLASTGSVAGELSVKFTLSQLKVVEYHRPYVAVWLENADQSFAANLAVWYETRSANNKGQEWLKDLRQWWRKSGRELQLPIDGLSGATRAPGEHQLTFSTSKSPLSKLPAGEYRLVVEAVREVGGREQLSIPFKWPAATGETMSATGQHELGALTLNLKP